MSEALANHPAQIIILEEILAQLKRYGELMEERGGDERLESLKETADIIKEILEKKEEDGLTAGALENDLAFKQINKLIKEIK